MGPKCWFGALGAVLLSSLLVLGQAHGQKHGGVLRATIRDNPPNLSIHEGASTDTTAPMSTVYNRVVVFDVFQAKETLETVVPDLAESWSWRNGNRDLAFALRRGVRWHDGKPFTSKDVQHTFDMVRGVGEGGLKLNPRKLWYSNVSEIVTQGDHEVVFKLKQPQPSLLAMLASGMSPVYPAHKTAAEVRVDAVGTGPFTLKEFKRDQYVEVVKNPAYFVKGRPYLDGAKFHIIKSAPTQVSALIANQVDTGTINTVTRPQYLTLKQGRPELKFVEIVSNATINIIVNTKRAPLNNLRLRQAINLAMDRHAFLTSIYKGGAEPGGAMIPHPWGIWGLTGEQIKALPGYGDPQQNKAEARRMLAAEGYGPDKPLRIEITTRGESAYVGPATLAIDQLREVGIEATLKTVEIAIWYGLVARRDYQMGLNATAIGIDDPDAVLFENYECTSQRNYSDYCNPEVERKFVQQSLELDSDKRRALVRSIDIQLQHEVARPYLAYRKFYYPHYPYVKNWLPHTSIYNGWSLQEVWLDN
ncbi:MAG: ABC transporter substrate-binding protein [Candidatus Lambdaproteobacteria bacterium]|nr:ABC transporter substrate-binding protein [Candidatus Lambdaproteobacteria bacterium]